MTHADPSRDPLAYARAVVESPNVDPGMVAGIFAAVLGRHHAIVIARPGVGTTMAARAAWGLLRDLEIQHPRPPWAIEVAMLRGDSASTRPPIRMPHHTVSIAGMLGGGSPPRPGEVSLATDGVLFLDNWPEFRGPVRQPIIHALRDGEITIYHRGELRRFPARTTCIATAMPCPCGYADHEEKACVCPRSSALWRGWQRAIDEFVQHVPGARRIDPTPRSLWDPYRAALVDILRRSEAADTFADPGRAVYELERCDPRWQSATLGATP